MFVVRLTIPDALNDFKAFDHRSDAERWFHNGWVRISEYDSPSAALYEVASTGDVRDAVAAVKEARANVRLIGKLPPQIDLDLSELGL